MFSIRKCYFVFNFFMELEFCLTVIVMSWSADPFLSLVFSAATATIKAGNFATREQIATKLILL